MKRILMLFAIVVLWPQSSVADQASTQTSTGASAWALWWRTADQQGQKLFDEGRYIDASKQFSTPDRIGAALFQAGEFEQAAAVFGRSSSPEAAYNRGNALVMQGKYEDAIASYSLALEKKPGWPEAEQNLRIARLRLEALAPPEDDYGGTGGQLGADKIVLDNSGRVNKSSSEEVVEEAGQTLSDEEMRALWLRRVQPRPADFLAAKFARQLLLQQQDGGDE